VRNRKTNCFLAILTFTLVFQAALPQQGLHNTKIGKVISDVAPLRTTILMSIGNNIFKSSELGSASHPFFRSGLPRGAIQEHAQLVQVLKDEGVKTFDVADLLDSAISNARKQEALAGWVSQVFPATAERILDRIDELDANSLLSRRDDHFYVRDANSNLDPLFPGLSSMYWSRDFAVSTPKGIIIGNGKHYNRSIENSLARFIFRYSDQLSDFPVVFDSEKEGVNLDGGDTTVLDSKTLLLGVGNRTSLEAAPKLAQKLGMDVLAVAMPPWEPANGMRRQLLHLDSIFNIVDKKTVLAVPYFLEKKYNEENPIAGILLGLAEQITRINGTRLGQSIGDPETLRTTVELMPQVGWVTRYKAGTGEAEELKLKLVDYFRGLGYAVVYVGGAMGSLPHDQYAIERALYELRWQGANVVQVRPGRVIAYEHNILTNQALRDAGIEVVTFQGELLSIRNGGPHCLLMPLVRY
jgi:arginine deiminase